MDNSAETLTHTRGCQVWLHLNNDSKLHRSVCFSPFSAQLWNCFWWLGSSRIASVLRPHQKIHTNQFLPYSAGKRARSNTTIKNTHQNGSQHSNGRLVSGACMTMNKRRLFSALFHLTLANRPLMRVDGDVFVFVAPVERLFCACGGWKMLDKFLYTSSQLFQMCPELPSMLSLFAFLLDVVRVRGGMRKMWRWSLWVAMMELLIYSDMRLLLTVCELCVGECGRILTVVDSNFSVALKTIFHSCWEEVEKSMKFGQK